MNITIYTSSPEAVDPEEVAALLSPRYLVLTVDVNEGERVWSR